MERAHHERPPSRRRPRVGSVDLSGRWHAIWQTTVDGHPNINTEVVTVAQARRRLRVENLQRSPENPIGGYLWCGEGSLHDNHAVTLSYAATETRVTSRGVLYLIVNPSGDYLVGRWVGCNIDSNLSWGYGVLAKDKERGMTKMELLLGVPIGSLRHPPDSASPADNSSALAMPTRGEAAAKDEGPVKSPQQSDPWGHYDQRSGGYR